MPRELRVLALNTGSSSLKFGLYYTNEAGTTPLLSGSVQSIGEERSNVSARDASGQASKSEAEHIPDQRTALLRAMDIISQAGLPWPDAVGHRIVHGGPKLLSHCLIDGDVVRKLESAASFAPLHVPQALAALRFAQEYLPGVRHVACFDTAFHAALPDVARVLPVARELEAQGFRRYGFHGLSCKSVLYRLGAECPRRIVISHLGSGASVTAVKDGRSIDTSMGLTPTGGVVMSTRCGDLDPGAAVYLMREKGLDAAGIEDIVDRHGGLAAISGIGGDMRALREASASHAGARLAIEMFCYSVRKQIAAMAAALDGLDLLVFTGGIGQNDASTRSKICAGLGWMGVVLDVSRNGSTDGPLNVPSAPVAIRVLSAQENEQIARNVFKLFA